MRARLAALGVPTVVLASIFGGTFWASKSGMIPPAVAFYLWPCLVALLFLAFGVAALLLGSRRALWPLGTGFVVQAIGTILLWAKVFDTGWQVFTYTIAAVVLVLLFMVGAWLVVMLRTRWLERKMMEGLGGSGDSGDDLSRIREDMKEALALLRRAGKGSHAIYTLPWFLVLGRPQAGKTVAIKNSGLGLPVRKDWVKGSGGTHTCDWFFTNDLIFLDTPGRWVSEGTGAEDQKYWTELLKLLRKYRGRQPLDGLVVVVPAEDLLGKSSAELREQAGKIRDVLDLMHTQLRFRFPVYLVISKTDLVGGFSDFFRGLPAQRRHEIMGWSHEDPTAAHPTELLFEGFQRVTARLAAYRTEMMAKVASRRRARQLFFFTEEFKGLADPLADFVDVLFRQDRYHEAPIFRGFYFTSGTQGEGSPLSQAMSQMARSLGVTVHATQESESGEAQRSYFLLDLFRRLMVGDEGLVSRTAVHWLKRRRDTMLVAFLPAVLAIVALLLSVLSLALNSSVYSRVASRVPEIVQAFGASGSGESGEEIQASLRRSGELRDLHSKLDGFTLLRGWGMRRASGLADATYKVFKDRFSAHALEPTLARAEKLASDPSQSCLSRIDILHSVVWLRMGRRAQWSDDLSGFDKVWGLNQEDGEAAREELLEQYGYFKDRVDRSEHGSLLPSFSIAKIADSISRDCSAQGSTSALEAYRQFQENCRDAVSPQQIRECYSRLGEVLRYEEQDFQRFVMHFRDLKEDLAELSGIEAEADRGLEKLEGIDLAEAQTGECLTRFTDVILPEIAAYTSESEELIDPCKAEVDAVLDRARKYSVRDEVLKTQAATLQGDEDELRSLLRSYSEQCRGTLPGLRRLEFEVLGRVVPAYRRVSCLDVEDSKGATPAVARAPSMQLQWLTVPRAVAGSYQRAGLETKRQEWQTRLKAQEGFDQAQQRYETETIRNEVSEYAGLYSEAWTGYLRGLGLARRRSSVASWLKKLSATGEFATAIQPAAIAASAAESMQDSPLDAFGRRLGSLSRLPAFVQTDLPEYQNLLAKVAADLQRCERESAFWLSYRRGVASRAEGNSLADTIRWVERKASSGLASGSLGRLLRRPLDEAESYVRSDNLAQRQWDDLKSAHAQIATKYPFAGSELADPAELSQVIALLGAESGAVTRFEAASSSATLGPQTKRWTERARGLSQALFSAASDTPKPVKLRFTVEEATFQPEKLGEKIRLDEIQLYLGEGMDLRWKEGDPVRKTFDIDLLGDDASTYCYVGAIPSLRKGFLRRLVGSNWQEGKILHAATSEGSWAPMRLVLVGLEGSEGSAGQNEATLAYTLDVPMKKKNGKVLLRFRVEGENLGRLLTLLKRGLESPPSGMGE